MNLHSTAVEAAIEAAGDKLTAADKPLLELARTLATQMDATGLDGPGTRLAGTYLICVRTLAARIGTPPSDRTATPLARLRAAHADVGPDRPRGPRRATTAS